MHAAIKQLRMHSCTCDYGSRALCLRFGFAFKSSPSNHGRDEQSWEIRRCWELTLQCSICWDEHSPPSQGMLNQLPPNPQLQFGTAFSGGPQSKHVWSTFRGTGGEGEAGEEGCCLPLPDTCPESTCRTASERISNCCC